MRAPTLALALVTLNVLPLAAPARAAWSTWGAQVLPFGAPQLAVPDGSGGAFVIAHDGVDRVFAQRVTASGDRAPGWPANGALVCSNATILYSCLVPSVRELSATPSGVFFLRLRTPSAEAHARVLVTR